MQAYKNERYSGLDGAAQWVVDKFLGLPPEVNAFYTEARDLYVPHMDAVIDEIAQTVATGLIEAKDIIADGRRQVQAYVESLPQDLQEVGGEAAREIQGRFDALDQQVDEKENALIDALAQRLPGKLAAIDARIEALQAENRGLVDRALDMVSGVIQTIVEMKNMLLDVLSRAASVVEASCAIPSGSWATW